MYRSQFDVPKCRAHREAVGKATGDPQSKQARGRRRSVIGIHASAATPETGTGPSRIWHGRDPRQRTGRIRRSSRNATGRRWEDPCTIGLRSRPSAASHRRSSIPALSWPFWSLQPSFGCERILPPGLHGVALRSTHGKKRRGPECPCPPLPPGTEGQQGQRSEGGEGPLEAVSQVSLCHSPPSSSDTVTAVTGP